MLEEYKNIPGLRLLSDYISLQEQEQLLTAIEQQPWLNDLKRRVQHYGYRYDYKSRAVQAEQRLGPLPDWTEFLSQRFLRDGLLAYAPDQLIINEYEPGQGISAHIDCRPCFGDTILSLSLGSSCIMQFTHPSLSQIVPIFLEPCSLVVMQNEARQIWKHSIPARKTDQHEGRTITRGRRVSLTFRHVVVEDSTA